MNSPIPKRWQEILALRPSFTGTNEAFCKQHQISISSFYKYKSMQQVKLSGASPQFVRVEQQTQSIQTSIIETAKANGLLLYDYITACLDELCQPAPDIDSLLPWNFKG